jgi:hypothetical protein
MWKLVEVEWSWRYEWLNNGVEENVYGGEVEKGYRNLDIVIAMNFRNTISLEISFELLINSFEYYFITF